MKDINKLDGFPDKYLEGAPADSELKAAEVYEYFDSDPEELWIVGLQGDRDPNDPRLRNIPNVTTVGYCWALLTYIKLFSY